MFHTEERLRYSLELESRGVRTHMLIPFELAVFGCSLFTFLPSSSPSIHQTDHSETYHPGSRQALSKPFVLFELHLGLQRHLHFRTLHFHTSSARYSLSPTEDPVSAPLINTRFTHRIRHFDPFSDFSSPRQGRALWTPSTVPTGKPGG